MHIYVPDLNYCGRILFRSLSYLYEVGCTNVSADFYRQDAAAGIVFTQ